jgi:F-type H+-transporting ATPase subunit a
VWLQLGPVPITAPVATTWGIIVLLSAAAFVTTRRLELRPGRRQAVLEIVIGAIEQQIGEAMQTDPRRFLPLLGTLFIFVAVANLSVMLPGIRPPTAHLETAAALALIVFLSTQYYGIRERGVGGYLRSFAKPTLLMLPLNLLAEVTRTFSLMVRLFGNIMSGEFVIGIVVALAGLFVPVPLIALELLTGLVQAYIFTILAAVFIAAAIGTVERG